MENNELYLVYIDTDDGDNTIIPYLVAITFNPEYAEKVKHDLERVDGAKVTIETKTLEDYKFSHDLNPYHIVITRNSWSHPENYSTDPNFEQENFVLAVTPVDSKIIQEENKLINVFYYEKHDYEPVGNTEIVRGYFQFGDYNFAAQQGETYLAALKKCEWGNQQSMEKSIGLGIRMVL